MRGDEGDGLGLQPRDFERLLASDQHAAQHVLGDGTKALAGGRERERVGGALEQRRAQPLLERI